LNADLADLAEKTGSELLIKSSDPAFSAPSPFKNVALIRNQPLYADMQIPLMNDFNKHDENWVCKQCQREIESGGASHPLIKEELPIARFTDKTFRSLTCPRCGITELVDKS
jgi:hypothetical protein